jgi:hypothetical protein
MLFMQRQLNLVLILFLLGQNAYSGYRYDAFVKGKSDASEGVTVKGASNPYFEKLVINQPELGRFSK